MKILFMGGKDIGCGCLEYLLEREEDTVVGVIVDPPDTAGDRWYASATELALKKRVPIYSLKINSPEGVSIVRELSPDIIVVVYFDQILKKEIINVPRMGCVNLHMALAEQYRGCYPTTWAIINGEKMTGVTLHYIDEDIDTGEIIAQSEVPVTGEDTGETLYRKCTKSGIELLREYFPLIADGSAPRRKQVTSEATRSHKRVFPSREIDFSKPGSEIYDHIRALIFEPFPPPYFYIGKKKFIISEDREEGSAKRSGTDDNR